jgi:hypothetical protein
VISFEPRLKNTIAGGALAVAAAAFPYVGFPQSLSEPAEDVLLQLAETMEREEQQNGPLSENLVDPLTTLGLVYQESGEHALALAALQRAMHVVRANRGLRSLDQAPLLRLSIRNEEARGNVAGAWELEQHLLDLVTRHPDDLRAIPIFREVGDRRMALLDRYLAGETPPEIVLGCYYQLVDVDEGSCTSGGKHAVVQGILMDAWSSYLDAISVYLRNELYASDALRELEMELLRSSYLYGNYGLGSASLERLWGYDIANSEPVLTQLEALVRLADWDLLFGRVTAAHRQYLHVYELLERQDKASTASIARLFSPEEPIALPTFLQTPLATDADDSFGAIDVAFDVTWHGNAKRVEILDATPNVTDDAKKQLMRLISWTRFRPKIVDGDIPQSSRVVLRHYLNPRTGVSDVPKDDVRRRNIRHYRADMGLSRHFIEDLPPAHSMVAGSE